MQGDMVVIGGGITGALTSCALIKCRLQCNHCLIKEILGRAALLPPPVCYNMKLMCLYMNSPEMIGEENAAFCYKSGIDAIKDLEKMISETKIDCGFE